MKISMNLNGVNSFQKKEQLYKLSKSTMDNNQIFSVSCTEVLLDKN